MPGELLDFPLVADRDPPMSAGNLFAKVIAMKQLLSLPFSSSTPSNDSSVEAPDESSADQLDIDPSDDSFDSSSSSSDDKIIPGEDDDSFEDEEQIDADASEMLDEEEGREHSVEDEASDASAARAPDNLAAASQQQPEGYNKRPTVHSRPAGPSRLKRILNSLPEAIYPGLRSSSEESLELTDSTNADLYRAAAQRDPMIPSDSQSDPAIATNAASAGRFGQQ